MERARELDVPQVQAQREIHIATGCRRIRAEPRHVKALRDQRGRLRLRHVPSLNYP